MRSSLLRCDAPVRGAACPHARAGRGACAVNGLRPRAGAFAGLPRVCAPPFGAPRLGHCVRFSEHDERSARAKPGNEDIGPKDVIVVGWSVEGALAALALAKQGFHVDVYDAHASPRDPAPRVNRFTGPSAVVLNGRALEAIESLGATLPDEKVAIKGGVWHRGRGAVQLPVTDGAMCAVDRRQLILHWMDEIDALPVGAGKVEYHWGHRMEFLNTEREQAVFVEAGEVRDVLNVPYRLLIGADGARSAVRRCLNDQVDGFICEQTTGKLRYYRVRLEGEGHRMGHVRKGWDERVHTWAGLVRVPMATQPATVHVQAVPGCDGAAYVTVGVPERLVKGYEWKTDKALTDALTEGLRDFPREWAEAVTVEIRDKKRWTEFREGSSTRCTLYNGPRAAVVGDAAHSMAPSLLLGASAAVQGVAILVEELAKLPRSVPSMAHSSDRSEALAAPGGEAVNTALEAYTKRWRHDAFSAVDMSEQLFSDLRTVVAKGRVADRFKGGQNKRKIERLTGVENFALLLASRILPFVFRPPGVWRAANTRERYSDIFRDMRRERQAATGALALLAALAATAAALTLRLARAAFAA
ncbi:unnamed protein product [Pedinophyceae sp. YPF-701]|nr:unnamed protein product [Pedinophyceae sp. YPF-701]